jgi:hypothetical protein
MGGRIVKLVGGLIAAERLRVYAVLKAKLLKLAVGGTGAGEAVLVVSGKNKLECGLASRSYLLGIGLNSHTFGNRIYTSGYKSAGTGCFNNTNTARANLVLFFHIAEGGDLHACCAGCFKNGRALGYAYSNTVNSYI